MSIDLFAALHGALNVDARVAAVNLPQWARISPEAEMAVGVAVVAHCR
jgi:hypothetical protein